MGSTFTDTRCKQQTTLQRDGSKRDRHKRQRTQRHKLERNNSLINATQLNSTLTGTTLLDLSNRRAAPTYAWTFSQQRLACIV